MKSTLKISFVLLLFSSCKSTHDSHHVCDYTYVNKDSIILTTEHINLDGICSEDTSMCLVINDTMCIYRLK